MNNKGFTLVEVLAVVAIVAIVSIITVPNLLKTLDTGKNTSDDILYDNIKIALKTMYEEKYYSGNSVKIYKYDNNGIDSSGEVTISDDSITTNIQTLVGNGFLTGINNNGSSTNTNSKIVFNSKNEDIGVCGVKITKVKDGNKICYKVEKSSGGDICPTTEDFGGSNQCS